MKIEDAAWSNGDVSSAPKSGEYTNPLPAPNFFAVVFVPGLGVAAVEVEEEEEAFFAIHQGTIVTVSSIPDSSVDDDADTYDTCAWMARASSSVVVEEEKICDAPNASPRPEDEVDHFTF